MDEPNSFCDTEMIISGAGLKNTAIDGAVNATQYDNGSTAGFYWMEIKGNNATGRFYDSGGNTFFERKR